MNAHALFVRQFRRGISDPFDLIVVEDERSSPEWWKGTDPRGNRGFFPSAFCETMVDEEDPRHEEGEDAERAFR